MPVDPSPNAAEVLAEAENEWVNPHALGDSEWERCRSRTLPEWLADALLAHAPESPDGIRRVVLEGRSGQDARIRGLEREAVLCPDGSLIRPGDPFGRDGDTYADFMDDDEVLYRLTDPSPEEA